MALETTVSVEPAKSMAQLNTIVAQQEGFHGALTAIGNDGSVTLLTFENTPKKPEVNAVIAPQEGGRPSVPVGATLVCTGTVFVAGQLTLSAATRAGAPDGA